jgi:hypothetical protein
MGPTHNCWKTVRPRRPTRQKYLARVPCLGAVHPRHRGHAAAGPLHPWVRLTPMCALSSLSSAQARRECQHHFPASTAIAPHFYPSSLCSCTVAASTCRDGRLPPPWVMLGPVRMARGCCRRLGSSLRCGECGSFRCCSCSPGRT